MDTHKVISVQAMDNKNLLVMFDNGVEKKYDCHSLLELPRFQLLKTEAFFKAVKVDVGGYGVSWSDDVDLSEDELWVNGV